MGNRAGPWREEAGIRAFADRYALAVLVAFGSKRRPVLPPAIATTMSVAAMVQLVRFVWSASPRRVDRADVARSWLRTRRRHRN